ncbi:MAG TPA: gas vesicle protein GvpJ [Candidatus Limnocylindria bacterium]|nr:gas vesicle protein GvpJ [Candidatus Limnocylindria bacterium]
MALVDVLERVLAKGIVIAYQADVSVVGLRVIEVDGCAVVMALETYVEMTEPPSTEAESSEALMAAVDEYLHRLAPSDPTPPM